MVDEVKFKKGDIVRCIRGTSTTNYLILGKNYIVENYIKSIDMVVVQGLPDQWHSNRFELVKEEFDMKTNPWFIRVNNKEEFDIVADFLKLKGFIIEKFQTYEKSILGFTNTNALGNIISDYSINRINQADIDSLKSENAKEIKIEFETKIKSISYPKIKSKKDLEIEKIEKEMRNLADRLNKLKGD